MDMIKIYEYINNLIGRPVFKIRSTAWEDLDPVWLNNWADTLHGPGPITDEIKNQLMVQVMLHGFNESYRINSYFIIYLFSSLILGLSVLVVSVKNPIHAILLLISVFLLSSGLLMFGGWEYFGLLFIIVYVGAIVVLFLFIVMMLEIKIVNTSIISLSEFFSVRALIGLITLLELFAIFVPYLPTTHEQYEDVVRKLEPLIFFTENNLYIDYSLFLHRLDQLKTLGSVLFTEYKVAILTAGLLLFVSMVGSIVLTLDISSRKALKAQDPNIQALRHPVLTQNSFRAL